MTKTLFIDVREPDEYASGHAPHAINIPVSRLMHGEPTELRAVPRDTKLVVYCRSGNRAGMCLPLFERFGFQNVVNGINAESAQRQHS